MEEVVESYKVYNGLMGLLTKYFNETDMGVLFSDLIWPILKVALDASDLPR